MSVQSGVPNVPPLRLEGTRGWRDEWDYLRRRQKLSSPLVFKFGALSSPAEEDLANEEAGQILWQLQTGSRLSPAPINFLEPYPSETPSVRRRRLSTPIPPPIPTPRGIEGDGRRHLSGQLSGKSLGLR